MIVADTGGGVVDGAGCRVQAEAITVHVLQTGALNVTIALVVTLAMVLTVAVHKALPGVAVVLAVAPKLAQQRRWQGRSWSC